MSNASPQEFTDIEQLGNIPLSELVEPQWLDLPEIIPQDLEIPTAYLQDLMERGVIGEDNSVIDIDTKLLEGPALEPPFGAREEALQERDIDFGR